MRGLEEVEANRDPTGGSGKAGARLRWHWEVASLTFHWYRNLSPHCNNECVSKCLLPEWRPYQGHRMIPRNASKLRPMLFQPSIIAGGSPRCPGWPCTINIVTMLGLADGLADPFNSCVTSICSVHQSCCPPSPCSPSFLLPERKIPVFLGWEVLVYQRCKGYAGPGLTHQRIDIGLFNQLILQIHSCP